MRLSEQEKHVIVTLLAQFHRPADVVVQLREHFGVEVDRFQVRSYDPTNPRYEAGEKWRSIFKIAREAHLRSVDDVPIAHLAYRLGELQKLYERAAQAGNLVLASALLRQAAWETCGMKAARPAPSAADQFGPASMSAAERRERVGDMLKAALEQAGTAPQISIPRSSVADSPAA